ncbi:MAG: hypothetical protein JOZ58_15225 [Acetobacteraceae bacterium]|nr:hypothetical protein [Acetobacteraceae bacterium]MBV8576368.1 hypothetical protein [Acetobacteraceae bacterium]
MATKIGNLITLDGTFTDWPASDMIMTPGNTVAGYQVYGALLSDATLGNTDVVGIDATATTDPHRRWLGHLFEYGSKCRDRLQPILRSRQDRRRV